MDRFSRLPAQARVVRLMMTYGLRVAEGKVHCGEIPLKDSSIARVAGVDRRAVAATVRTIEGDSELSEVFSRLRPACDLLDVAPLMGWGSVKIVPAGPSGPGVLAGITEIIAEAGIGVRQALMEDDAVSDHPRAHIVTDGRVPERLLPRIAALDGVESVALQ